VIVLVVMRMFSSIFNRIRPAAIARFRSSPWVTTQVSGFRKSTRADAMFFAFLQLGRLGVIGDRIRATTSFLNPEP
jgi:hypothetical protein